ncbi:MAG TPA: phenylalanine--tRNA ligase subunit alpha [Coxiellaceae bacterium]|nr:MAG: phenylalanine--tRNA ligase subunit alpha [Gammaproteobacteria bacterium RIFCSPHIGHO2_12_FULL_36_30]HLB57096.1 phenylalanine--tRNA ligase subunit alpha [Coxiellaceae bacterium]
MQNELNAIVTDATNLIYSCKTAADLQELRVKYFGKKSQLTELMKRLSQVDAAERPKMGQLINDAKIKIQTILNDQENKFKQAELSEKLSSEKIDITLPGRGQQSAGSVHPVTLVRQRALDLFKQMGFTVAEGPEIEDDYHNFSALNFVDHHPAKESQDTFYFPDGRLLRTHTSPVQIRVMKKEKPPLRIITPGRVYRRDSDMTHTPMFHQLEGLVVDENCTFANLKKLLHDFLNLFFEKEIPLRFRPAYFPFTEPSAEVDIGFQDRWMEVLGCGMVHPAVLENVGIDSKKYSGFAFGVGLDRLAMLRYNINDLRMMFENDVRFLAQF